MQPNQFENVLRSLMARTAACPFCECEFESNTLESVSCPQCGSMLSYLELSEPCSREDRSTPSKCFVERLDDGVKLSASHQSLAACAVFTIFALIWNALVGGFAILIISGMMQPKVAEELERSQVLIVGMLLLVFKLPFLVAGVSMLVIAAFKMFGWTEVYISSSECRVVKRLFFLRWSKGFNPEQIRGATIRKMRSGTCISFLLKDGAVGWRFAKNLPSDRSKWLRASIASIFARTQIDNWIREYPELKWLESKVVSGRTLKAHGSPIQREPPIVQ